jgi:hypothetical protein
MMLDSRPNAADDAAAPITPSVAPATAPAIELVKVVSISGERAWVRAALTDDGALQLALASFALDETCVDRVAAMMHIGGQPVLLGLVRGWADPTQVPKPLPAASPDQVIEAESSLTLRCGEASLSLSSDGHLVLRGKSVSSYARGTQRLRGAVVEIN